MEAEYIIKSELKSERNWTETMIKKYLGSPDKTSPNIHYSKAAPFQYFLSKKILLIEEREEFKSDMKKRIEKKIGSQKGIETKKKKLLEKISQISLKVDTMDDSELEKRAIRHYEDYWEDKRNRKFVDSNNLDKINRLKVNYLRHCLSNYEFELQKIVGKTGKDDAYFEINKKIYSSIADKYPYLKDECENQLSSKIII